MIFISICDDDRIHLEELKNTISDFCEEKSIECHIETILKDNRLPVFQKRGNSPAVGEFHFREGIRELPFEQILFIESYGHILEFTVCIQSSIRKYTMFGKLNDMQNLLVGNDFVRTHQSYLVNLRHIRSMSNNELTLQNGRILSVSRSRYAQAKKIFLEYEKKVQDGT